MLKKLKLFTILLIIAAAGYLGRTTIQQKTTFIADFLITKVSGNTEFQNASIQSFEGTIASESRNENSNAVGSISLLYRGKGIVLLETTDRMAPPSLVLCAIESAARVYPDRPVVFFMKGLSDLQTEEDQKRTRNHYPTLSPYNNIFFFPLRMEELFTNTPLLSWYKQVDPKREVYWTHVSSDACRFALMWKYGGIYMDTDVISIRPIPKDNFMAAETRSFTSSSVFGLSPQNNLTWEFMENFVQNYRGEKWGHQGPGVFTRVVTKTCGMPKFTSTDDVMCGNVSYFHPQRFYPILHIYWRKYFEVWKDLPTFDNSYALHFWNFMNKEGKTIKPGSNTLVELIYKQHCPSTYGALLRNERTYI